MRYGVGRSARSLSFIGQPRFADCRAGLETVPSRVADGAQALKRAGDGQDFTINPPENGVRRRPLSSSPIFRMAQRVYFADLMAPLICKRH